MKILKTNALTLAVLFAVSASSAHGMSYVNAGLAKAKSAASAARTQVATAASYVAGKAKSAAAYVGDTRVAKKAAVLASAAKANTKAAAVWTLTKHSSLCDRVNGGIDWASRGAYGKFVVTKHPRVAKAVATGLVAGTVYAGYKGAQWAYNKAKQAIAARKAQETTTTTTSVAVEPAAPVVAKVAKKAVRFADLTQSQKTLVLEHVRYRAQVNAAIKAGNKAYATGFANVTPDAVAQDLFGKIAA